MNKKILFVSTESIVSKLAEIIFTAEAKKNDVVWEACAKVTSRKTSFSFISESISTDALKSVGVETKEDLDQVSELNDGDLESCDLVVELKLPGQEEIIETQFDKKLDVWRLNNDVVEELKLYVSNLMVRLIMQGGKREPLAQKKPEPSAASGADKKNAKVRVTLDKKKRRGKKVTTITGLPLADKELYELAARLKQLCGAGGTVKDGSIEVQGDKCDQILNELTKLGYKPKRSGG